MSNEKGKKRGVGVLVTLVVVLAIVVVMWMNKPGPAAAPLTPARVQQMIDDGSLIGLSFEEAADRLNHDVPHDPSAHAIVLDFNSVPDWNAGSLELSGSNHTVERINWVSSDR